MFTTKEDKINQEIEELLNYYSNKEKVEELVRFRNYITALGFEVYVKEFFESKKYWFKTFHNWGYEDKGIDIKGARNKDDWKKEFILIQCKKWSRRHIKLDHIASWYWKIVDIINWEINVFKVFATTTWVTQNVKKFCEEKSIHLIDYEEIIKMLEDYNLENFITFIIKQNKYMIKDIINKEYLKDVYLKKNEIFWLNNSPKQFIYYWRKTKKENNINDYQKFI